MGAIPKLDIDKASKGVLFQFGARENAFLVRIGRMGNPVHKKAIERIRKDFFAKKPSGYRMTDDEGRRIADEAIAEGIIFGWDGLADEDTNEPIVFSKDAAFAILQNPVYEEFRDWVLVKSNEQEAFHKERRAEIVGN